MAESGKKVSAVYVSFTTFKSALEQLGHGIPSKVDRSVFVGLAWSIQSQLFSGLRFLGLINADNEPTETLEELVKGPEAERKERLKQVLEQRYAALFALDLTRTTPQQLGSKMADLYDVGGDTKEKAVRFFLSAVEYVGIPLSPYFKRGKSNGNGSTPRKRSPRKGVTTEAVVLPVTHPLGHSGTAKSVKLGSGGTLTLTATLDLFALNASDRKFVFELIDRLEAYEKTEVTV